MQELAANYSSQRLSDLKSKNPPKSKKIKAEFSKARVGPAGERGRNMLGSISTQLEPALLE